MRTSGNTVLITGGATGIGLALAQALLGRDNEVTICGRRRERLDEAKKAEPRLHVKQADVADDRSRVDLVQWIEREFPAMNVLVNNAGIQHRVDLRDVEDLAKAEEEVAINFMAPLYLTARFLPHLLRQSEPAIMNVSSGLAFSPMAHMPVYCATKAAVHSVTMSLRHQLRDTPVRVFEVIPPLVASELGAYHRPADLNRIAMPAAEAARAIIDAMQRDELELAIGDAARSREKREALFGVMNNRA